MLRLSRAAMQRGEPADRFVAAPLDDAERAIVDGWLTRGKGLEELEPQLAAIGPRHPLAREARWLRASWRIRSGDPELARQAVRLSDEILGARRAPRSLLLRAQAQAAAGDPAGALHTLAVIGEQARAAPVPPGALATARAIPASPEFAELRAHTLRLLQPRRARRPR
jgi:hypothetical protein